MKTIALIGALDTKGPEYTFVKNDIERRGHRAFVINTGVIGEPAFVPDVSAADVAKAGGASLHDLRTAADRAAGTIQLAPLGFRTLDCHLQLVGLQVRAAVLQPLAKPLDPCVQISCFLRDARCKLLERFDPLDIRRLHFRRLPSSCMQSVKACCMNGS